MAKRFVHRPTLYTAICCACIVCSRRLSNTCKNITASSIICRRRMIVYIVKHRLSRTLVMAVVVSRYMEVHRSLSAKTGKTLSLVVKLLVALVRRLEENFFRRGLWPATPTAQKIAAYRPTSWSVHWTGALDASSR